MLITDKEDKFLLASVEDKIIKASDFCIPSCTPFLDMRQQTMVEDLCKRLKARFSFDGGYEDSERRICIVKSEYCENEEYLSFIRINASSSRPLTHRDYLGALMGLGIKRSSIGDILVREDGADIVVLREITGFLISDFEKAGRANLKLFEISRDDLTVPELSSVLKKDTVSSLRLDSVCSVAFSVSRTVASELIASGKAYVNGRQILKNDFKLSEDDKIVIRGKGKAVLKTVGGLSKKDRIFITIEKFI